MIKRTLATAMALSVTNTVLAVDITVTELASGLNHPWGMTFLPDGDMLVTERSGHIRRFSKQGGLGKRLKGLPDVEVKRQGGMLDVIVDPEFSQNQQIYFCNTREDGNVNGSAVAKATLGATGLSQVEHIFISDAKVNNGFHFGCRLAFDAQQHLYVALGDRYVLMEQAQDPQNHAGTIVRIDKNGKAISSNPFIDGDAPEVFTYGHRNVQGLTIHPTTGHVWAMEHGPKGGDEVNLLSAGNNYGWPAITYGIDYDGDIISDKTAMEGMQQPVLHWTPSIAPSGMAFYYGDAFPQWQGDLLVGSLKFRHLRLVEMDGDKPGEQSEYLRDRNERIRDVKVGPDGLVYVLTDERNGKLLQLSPK